jgi:outer membrane protein TolC
MNSPLFGITMGDSSGVGPEILLLAAHAGRIPVPYVVYGDLAPLARLNQQLTLGLTLGLGLTYPLYDGGFLKSRTEVARVGAERAALQTEARQLELTAALDDQLSAYQTQQAILAYEEENVGNARESLSISTERFRLGQTNSLEVQQAQSTFEQTLGRRNLVRFNIKQAEVQLRLLAGQL